MWALDHSPSRLRQIALQRLEAFFCPLSNSLSSQSLRYWKAFLLGVQTRTDPEQLRTWVEGLTKDTKATRDFLTLACVTYTFGERFDSSLVCDQPPFWVPIDQVHLFDLAPSDIRTGLADAIKQVEGDDIPNMLGQFFAAPSKMDESNLVKFRPLMDRLAAFLLRFSEGLEIHNLAVRSWVAINAYRARHAIDPRERDSAVRSLEVAAGALLPPNWVGRTPNEAGLSLEYIQMRDLLAPLWRKKFRNPAARLLALEERLPGIERRILEAVAESTLSQGVLTVLADKYGLSQGYLKNLVKRGNLFHKVCAHWFQSLAGIALDTFFAPLT